LDEMADEEDLLPIIAKSRMKNYTLAKILPSHVVATKSLLKPTIRKVSTPRNLEDLIYPRPLCHNSTNDTTESELMLKLIQMYQGGKSVNLLSLVEQSFKWFRLYFGSKTRKYPNDMVDTINSKDFYRDNFLCQPVINALVPFSITSFLNSNLSPYVQQKAFIVFLACLKTRRVSARWHLDQVKLSQWQDGNTVLSRILASLNHLERSKEETNNGANETHISKINTEKSKNPTNFEEITICTTLALLYHLLRYCHDSLSESMLVTLVHYVLCYTSPSFLHSQWISIAKNNSFFYHEPVIKLERLERQYTKKLHRLSQSQSSSNTSKLSILQKKVHSLQIQLFVSRKVFLIYKIVTYTKCNDGLLRVSIHKGLSHSSNGEIVVLLQVLNTLLRYTGQNSKLFKYKHTFTHDKTIRTYAILQWISALIDSHLFTLLDSSPLQFTLKIKAQLQRGVSLAISHTEALFELQDLIRHVETLSLECKNGKLVPEVKDTKIPRYSIETLVIPGF